MKMKILLLIFVVSVMLLGATVLPAQGGVGDLEQTRTFGYGMTFDVAYSPDGSKLAVGNATGTDIWNTSNWQLYNNIIAYTPGSTLHDYLEGRYNPSSDPDGAAAWSGDGTKICTPTEDCTLHVYNPATGEVLASMDGHIDVIRTVAFSSDGSRVASGSWPSTASNSQLDKVAKVWNASTGALVNSLDGHTDGVAGVSLNSDGSLCASVDKDNSVEVWNVSTGSVVESINHSGVMACAFSPDDTMLAIAGGNSNIKILDTSDWSTLHTLTHADVLDLDWTSNSGTLASAGGSTVKTWNASTGANLKTYNSINVPAGEYNDGLNGVAIAPDGSQVACCGAANAVEAWDTSTDEKLVEMDNHVGVQRPGDISPDETMVASPSYTAGTYSPDIIVWDMDTGEIVATCDGHTDQVTCATFSPDSTKIASTSRDAKVKIWNASTGALIRTINASASYTRHVEWSPDGTMLVSGSRYNDDKYKGYCEVWNASTGANIRSWYEDGEFYWCCFSPDGTEVAGGGREDKIYTWNISTGSKTGTYSGHSADVYSCDWSHDGYEIASCGADNKIKIWDVSTEDCVLTKDGVPDVRCVAWSPDDTMVGSTKANSMVFIIDSGNGDVLRQTYENGCGTNSITWITNDSFATFGDDGTARIFGVSEEPPGKATNPSPADEATDVGVNADLSWTAGSGADSHDVYFGTTSPGDSKGNQSETTYNPGTMANNTTYYWRIDEKNEYGTTTGDVWSFTTIAAVPPGKATNPSPADEATSVSTAADLSWTAGSGADSHDVYFGTTSPGDSKGNQAETTYEPGTMSYETTYYWRIDEVNPYGTTTGDVWSFTTLAEGAGEYTEAMDKWDDYTTATWETYDLSGFSVPANAVVEVCVKNGSGSSEAWGGVRAVGSSIDRRIELHEGEGSGEDVMSMHVQANGSSQIQHYADGNIDFYVLGWWSSGTYVEKIQSFKAGSSGSWVDKDLSGYGVGAGNVAEILLVNTDAANEQAAGARTNGSSLSRKVALHEAEAGGVDVATMLVKTDGSSTIEVYAGSNSAVDFYLLGSWSTAPGTYTEKFVDVGKPSSDGTWQDRDLSTHVPASVVCEMLMCNGNPSSENWMGVRENGSSLQRRLDVHEAEEGGRDCLRMHVTPDASSTIEQYMEDVSDTAEFYLLGYWQ